MLLYALIVFLVAACGGLVLASFVLRGKLAPWVVSLLHADVRSQRLTLAGGGDFDGRAYRGMLPVVALCVFLVTACFGFYLASIHYGKRVALSSVWCSPMQVLQSLVHCC